MARGVLEEFTERSFSSTSRRDGRFVEKPRHAFPSAHVVETVAPAFEVYRQIEARIAHRRIARRRVLWLPIEEKDK